MRANHLFASAAVLLLSVAALPAHAQLLGGGLRGGAAGGFGSPIGGAQVGGFGHARAAGRRRFRPAAVGEF